MQKPAPKLDWTPPIRKHVPTLKDRILRLGQKFKKTAPPAAGDAKPAAAATAVTPDADAVPAKTGTGDKSARSGAGDDDSEG